MHTSIDPEIKPTFGQSGSEWFDLYDTSLHGLADFFSNDTLLDPTASAPEPSRADRPSGGTYSLPNHTARIRTTDPLEKPGLEGAGATLPIGDDAPESVHQFEGLRLFADDPRQRGRVDDVLGVGPSAKVVARLTLRQPVELALDLGCGGGLLGMLAARHTTHVIGTDINPRAVAVAIINARWNEISNIEFRQGDLFEPVQRLRFDLIMSNPPLVISPDYRFYFRDGGGPETGICDRILTELPRYLEEGGTATIQCHWPVHNGETWWARPAKWAKRSGCDLWLISHGIQPPETYSRLWLENTDSDGSTDPGTLDRWLGWYQRNGIVRLSSGVLILRKRSEGPNWARGVIAPRAPAANCSAQLGRIFRAHDFLTSRSNASDLLSVPLNAVEGVEFAAANPEPAGAEERVLASLEPDLGYSVPVSPATVSLWEGLDGRTAPRELIRGAPPDTESVSFSNRILSDLTQLVGSGYLLPPPGGK